LFRDTLLLVTVLAKFGYWNALKRRQTADRKRWVYGLMSVWVYVLMR